MPHIFFSEFTFVQTASVFDFFFFLFVCSVLILRMCRLKKTDCVSTIFFAFCVFTGCWFIHIKSIMQADFSFVSTEAFHVMWPGWRTIPVGFQIQGTPHNLSLCQPRVLSHVDNAISIIFDQWSGL